MKIFGVHSLNALDCNLFYDEDGFVGGVFGDCDIEDAVFVVGLNFLEAEFTFWEKNFSVKGAFFNFEKVGLHLLFAGIEVIWALAFDREGIPVTVDADVDILVGDSGEFGAYEEGTVGFENINFGHPSALADELWSCYFPAGEVGANFQDPLFDIAPVHDLILLGDWGWGWVRLN